MTMEEFSEGYYMTEMNLQPYDDGPVIQGDLYDFIDRRMYSRTNAPIMMRVGLDNGPHFKASGEKAVPMDVLAIPRQWMDDMMVDEGWQDVFILKPRYAYLLSQSEKLGERFESHNVND